MLPIDPSFGVNIMKIADIESHKILDSRGNDTIETELALEGGFLGTASIPSGTSVGKHEAKYQNTSQAIEIINNLITPKIVKEDFKDQASLDSFLNELDGTPEKSKLGANSILSISIAFCKASALALPTPLYQYIRAKLIRFPDSQLYRLPKLMTLIFEGGKHGDSSLTIQEFMYILDDISQPAILFKSIKEILKEKHLDTDTGLEGAYSPNNVKNSDILKMMHEFNKNISIALDVAQSSKTGKDLEFEKIISEFNVKSIEDPFGEDDWEKWVEFLKKVSFLKKEGKDILVVGDDLTVTNPKRIKKAAKLNACNAIIIKPNQIGTVTETIDAIKLAKKNGLKVIISHRSGETNDDFIADLAFGVDADYVKFGAPNRGERIAKYNRLMKIKEGAF